MKDIRSLGPALAAHFDGERRGASALEHRGRSVTYAELAVASQSVAEMLERQNLKKGAHVGVLAEDTSLIVPAMIGIMVRGCAFALLDPAHPPRHLRELATSADLACLLVEERLLPLATEAVGGECSSILPMCTQIYSATDSYFPVSTLLAETSDRPLYVYFSSGTSGRPKPILGRADSLKHFVDWEIATLGLDATVRVSTLTSPSHDPYLRDIFTPLVAGGTICTPDSRQVVLSPLELGRWLELARIQVVHCTPTIFRNLCHGGLNGRSFGSLTHVLIAGEQLRGQHLNKWYEVVGDRVQLINLYGPTETTLAKLYYFVSPTDVHRAAIPIGKPMDGAQVRIMATPSRECDKGEIGELYIETAFGTLGYYGQPALNQEVFEPDPSDSIDRPVIYKTGDLVKRLADGNIEFVGRRDRRQKVRGKQIDLDRVEDEIVARTEIGSCIVSVITSEDGESPDSLAVYYVADRDLEEQSLKHLLARELPKSMIPDVWIRVDSLPTNVNGKMNAAELAALLSKHEATAVRCGVGQDPGSTSDIEGRLLELWKELLRNESIGLDDPFMEIGGDSLTIMLLIARLDEDYSYELSLWQVFDNLTIRKLVFLIKGASIGGPTVTEGEASHAEL